MKSGRCRPLNLEYKHKIRNLLSRSLVSYNHKWKKRTHVILQIFLCALDIIDAQTRICLGNNS